MLAISKADTTILRLCACNLPSHRLRLGPGHPRESFAPQQRLFPSLLQRELQSKNKAWMMNRQSSREFFIYHFKDVSQRWTWFCFFNSFSSVWLLCLREKNIYKGEGPEGEHHEPHSVRPIQSKNSLQSRFQFNVDDDDALSLNSFYSIIYLQIIEDI